MPHHKCVGDSSRKRGAAYTYCALLLHALCLRWCLIILLITKKEKDDLVCRGCCVQRLQHSLLGNAQFSLCAQLHRGRHFAVVFSKQDSTYKDVSNLDAQGFNEILQETHSRLDKYGDKVVFVKDWSNKYVGSQVGRVRGHGGVVWAGTRPLPLGQ